MSEKLKTFIIYSSGDFVINTLGKINIALKVSDGLYKLRNESFFVDRNQLIKLFNLDLEVEDEN